MDIKKDVDEEYFIGSKNWLTKNKDERIVDYEPLLSGEYVIKYLSDTRIDKVEEFKKKYAISSRCFRSIT